MCFFSSFRSPNDPAVGPKFLMVLEPAPFEELSLPKSDRSSVKSKSLSQQSTESLSTSKLFLSKRLDRKGSMSPKKRSLDLRVKNGKKLGARGWRTDDTHERALEDRCQKHRCQKIAKTFILCAAVWHSRSPVSDQMKKQKDPGDFSFRKIVVAAVRLLFCFLSNFLDQKKQRLFRSGCVFFPPFDLLTIQQWGPSVCWFLSQPLLRS